MTPDPATLALVDDVRQTITSALTGPSTTKTIPELVQDVLDRHPEADAALKAELTAALDPDPNQMSMGAAIKMLRHLAPTLR